MRAPVNAFVLGAVCIFGRLQKCILQAPKNAFSCFLKVVAKFGWNRDRSCSCRPEQGKPNVWELRSGIPGLGTPANLRAVFRVGHSRASHGSRHCLCKRRAHNRIGALSAQRILSGRVAKCILRALVNAFVLGAECIFERLQKCILQAPKNALSCFLTVLSKTWMEVRFAIVPAVARKLWAARCPRCLQRCILQAPKNVCPVS